MDPRGAYKDIETLSAIERLFTPPCNIKILLTIDKNAKNADRGQSIIKRLTNLRSFFTDEEKLRNAISIVVTKQRISNGKALFESMGLFNIKPDTNEARDIAKATNTSEQDLVWVSSFLTHLRQNNRIFAFPEPKTIGSYNYGWFPDRGGLIKALTILSALNPEINIFANFSQDPSTLLLMERAAGRLTIAVDRLHVFFQQIKMRIEMPLFSSFGSVILMSQRNCLMSLLNIPEQESNTPRKLERLLRSLDESINRDGNYSSYSFLGKINSFLGKELCLQELRSSEVYLDFLNKIDKRRISEIWQTVPNFTQILRRHLSDLLRTTDDLLERMNSCVIS